MASIPLVDFGGSSIMYNDIIEILKERPNSLLNTLMMLIITLTDCRI